MAAELQAMCRPLRIVGNQPLFDKRESGGAEPVGGYAHRRKRRPAELAGNDVVEAEHGDRVGHAYVAIGQGLQAAERQIVGRAEDSGRVFHRRVAIEQRVDRSLAMSRLISLGLDDHIVRHGKLCGEIGVGKAVISALDRRAALPGQMQDSAVAERQQMLYAEPSAEAVFGRTVSTSMAGSSPLTMTTGISAEARLRMSSG